MSSNYCFNVTVYRDSLSTPWGFRLEGGKDYQSPLTIQRVFQGSPASGYLQRGDIIINIQNKDASQLFHQEANELIKRSGGSLLLTIKRGQPYPGSDGAAYHSSHIYLPQTSGTTRTVTSYVNFKPVSRTVTSYVDYDNRFHEPESTGLVRNRVIEKIHDPKPILSQTGSPILPYTGSSAAKSGFQLRRYQSSRTLPLPTTFNKAPIPAPVPSPPSQPTTPYQDKEMIDKIQSSLSRITTRPRLGSLSVYPSTPNIYTRVVYDYPVEQDEYGSLHVADKVAQFQHQSRQANQAALNQQRRQLGYHSVAYNPPWKGTLQRTGGYSSVSPIRPQQQPKPQPPPAPKGPIDFGTVGSLKIVNNQYNTPIGLYSNRNINEELNKQVGGSIRHHSQSGYELPASDF